MYSDAGGICTMDEMKSAGLLDWDFSYIFINFYVLYLFIKTLLNVTSR